MILMNDSNTRVSSEQAVLTEHQTDICVLK